MAAHIALVATRVTTALYALSLHASEFTVGILIALFAFFPMFFAVSMGRLIDRIGIKRPLTYGSLLLVAGCAIPSLIGGLPVLYLAAILIGTGFMAIHIGSQHAVGAMTTPDKRSVNFTWLSLGFSVSSFFGPVIAGLVIDFSQFSIAYAVSGGFALLSLALIAFGKLDRIMLAQRNTATANGSAFDLLREPDLRKVYVVGILLAAAWDLFVFVTPIRGSQLGLSASSIGLILGTFSVATFVVRLAMPRIQRRFTEWQVLAGSLILAAICYAFFPFMQQSISLMILAAILGLALGSSQPNILGLLHQAAPPGRGGEALGIRATIVNASQVFLPLAFGAAGATLGLFPVFWGISAMIGAGVPMAWRKATMK